MFSKFQIMEQIEQIIEMVSKILEFTGVIVIVVGIMYFLIRFLISQLLPHHQTYHELRQGLGKTILLGLEILVAADIIHTVIIDPTVTQVLVLGLIVVIRTFLSFSLQAELDGRLPWQPKK